MDTKEPTAGVVDAESTPIGAVIGWGVGSLGVALLYNTTNILLLRYLVDYVGLAATLAATLIAISKFYDVITDPIMGVISDRTRSSLGRRRPWLLMGGLLCAAALPLLFITPKLPAAWLTAWVMFGLLFYASAYTVFSVPYMAMPAEMTDDPHRRSVIFSWRVKAIAVGQLLAGGGGPALIAYFGGGQTGHAVMSMILGSLILVSTMLCFRFTRQARALPMVTAKGSSFREQVRTILADHNFAWLLVAKLAHLVAVAFGASTLAFFTLRVLELPDGYLALIIAASTVGIIAAAPVLTTLSRRIGKQRTYWVSVLIYAAVHTSWWFAQPGEAAALMVLRGIFMGIGAAGMMVIAQSLLADVMADDRARTGFSREGVYAGLYTTIEKLSFAVGIAMVGFLLGTAGYIEGAADGVEQPQAALDMIRLSVSVVPAALAIFAAVTLARVQPSMASAKKPPQA